MLSTLMLKLAERNQWRTSADETSIFGEFNGYLFTGLEGKGFKAFITPLAGINSNALKSLRRFLKVNYRPLRLRNFEISDNFLCLRMHEGLIPLSVEKMEYLLAQVSGLLSLSEMPAGACVVCGEPAPKRGLYYGLFCHLHPECQDHDLVDFTGSDYDELAELNSGDDVGDDHNGNGGIDSKAADAAGSAAGTAADAAAAASAVAVPVPESISPAEFSKNLETIAQTMSPYKDEMLDSLVQLCRIPSVKGPAAENAPYGEETVRSLEYFLSLGRKLGFTAVDLDHRAGFIEFGEGDPMTAVLGHLDVVPAGENWTTDPFEPVVESDRLICRGAIDDKGPVIAALYAMKALADEGFRPNGRIRLIVGLDEENGSACMAHYVKVAELPSEGFTPDATFPVIYAEKGCVWLDLLFPVSQPDGDYLHLMAAEAGNAPNMVPGGCSLIIKGETSQQELQIKGRSAHGSTPWLGLNAISVAMQEAYDRLSAAGCRHSFVDFYRDTIGSSWRGEGFGIAGEDESGPLTLNAGMLILDGSSARLTLDIRYPVTWDLESLLVKIRSKISPIGGSLAIRQDLPPLHVPKDSKLVRTLLSVYQDLTGSDDQPIAIGGATYARMMPNVVAFGPAFPRENETAHQAGEQISLTSLMAAAAIYREALRRLTGREIVEN